MLTICVDIINAAKHLINVTLERLSCILKSKGHSYKSKQIEWRAKWSLWDIIWIYRNLMEGTDEMDLGENGCTIKIGMLLSAQ